MQETDKKDKGFPARNVGKKIKSWIKRHKKLTAAAGIVLAVVCVFAYQGTRRKRMMAEMASVKTVSTTELKKQTLRNTIGVNGTIESETSSSIVTNVSSAEVSEVCVEVGDYVEAGDVICVLDGSTIEKNKEVTEENMNATKAKASLSVASAQRELEDAVETRDIQSQRNQDSIDKASDAYDAAVAEDNAAYESYEQALAKEAGEPGGSEYGVRENGGGRRPDGFSQPEIFR